MCTVLLPPGSYPTAVNKYIKCKVLRDIASGSSVYEDHRIVDLDVSIFRPKNTISLQMALFPNEVSLHTNK